LLVCAIPAYKSKGFFYTTESFDANVFQVEDIFDDTDRSDSAFKKFQVKPVATALFGRCYSLQLLEKVRIFDLGIKLKLKTKFDLYVYVHPQGFSVT
jgi:hypothetical protein